jgi:putative flippase GtrA
MRRAFKFCTVGALVFGLDFAAVWMLKQLMPALMAVSIAYIVAVAFHFCLNKWWIFAAETRFCAMEMARYVIAVMACWSCTIVVVILALRTLTSNVMVAKALAVLPTTLLGFGLMRWFVFRAASRE